MEHKADIIHLANPEDICLEIKKDLSQDSDLFLNNIGKRNKYLTKKDHHAMFEDLDQGGLEQGILKSLETYHQVAFYLRLTRVGGQKSKQTVKSFEKFLLKQIVK